MDAEAETLDAADSAVVRDLLARARPPAHVSRDALAATLAAVLRMGHVRHRVDVIDGNLPLAGARLLDVGCGACWSAPFVLQRGAAAYFGVDLHADPSEREILDLRDSARSTGGVRAPLSLGDFLACFEDARFVRADVLELEPEPRHDCAALLTVSEHFDRPAAALGRVAALLREGGAIHLVHGNYYAWNGHHSPPRTVREYDPSDAAMAEMADWNHVRNLARVDMAKASLNGIRIHELLAILDEHFEARAVEYVPSSPETGGGRLTDAVRLSLPAYYEAELVTELLCYRGVRRGATASRAALLPDVIPVRTDDTLYREERCWLARIPLGVEPGRAVLFEDGAQLGPRDASHEEIRRVGSGRYSVWGMYLYFSTSDDSDPRTNGRRYELRVDAGAPG